MALDLCRLVVRVIFVVAVALADRQRVVVRLTATPILLTLRSASSAANRQRRCSNTQQHASCISLSSGPRRHQPAPREHARAHAVARERQHRCPCEHVQQVAGSTMCVARSVRHSVAVTPRPRSLVANAPSANLAALVRLISHAAPIHTINAHYTHVQ
jgi:hypothetical protein